MMPDSRSRRRLSLPAALSLRPTTTATCMPLIARTATRDGGRRPKTASVNLRRFRTLMSSQSTKRELSTSFRRQAFHGGHPPTCRRQPASPLPATGSMPSAIMEKRLDCTGSGSTTVTSSRPLTKADSAFYLPAIGDQMIYVAGEKISGLESSVIEVEDEPNQVQRIWTYDNFDGAFPSTPPIYVSPGVRSLAELYIGTTSGRIYLLDANTGVFLDWYEGDRSVRSLAIDGTRLYAAGDDRLRAYRAAHASCCGRLISRLVWSAAPLRMVTT